MNRAFLLVLDEGPDGFPAEAARVELESLCRTAGLQAAAGEFLRVREPNPSTYLGSGRVAEFAGRVKDSGFETVVLNVDLSAVQQRNLEEAWGIPVLDRTSLILRIFSFHANSAEGKLQVDLARENYRLSRLTGRGVALSRLGGGIGTRGPGEMKLEEERRHIRESIRRLEERIVKLKKQRQRTRELRRSRGLPEVALVGYTNAGKSSILNILCGRPAARVADQLFATVDPTSRRLHLGQNRFAVITDTVGFVHNLPHTLVAAFHATLEGLGEAHLLLLVLDGGSPLLFEHYRTTCQVMSEVRADRQPVLLIVNKIDQLDTPDRERLKRKLPEARLVSARTGEGISELREDIYKRLWTP